MDQTIDHGQTAVGTPEHAVTSAGSPALGTLRLGGGQRPDREIVIYSLQVGYARETGAGSGQATGRVQFTDLSVTKAVDGASPQLLEATATRRNIPSVTIVVLGLGSTDESTRFGMSDVRVSAVDITSGDAAGGALVETVSFGFGQIRVRHTATDGTVIEHGWDVRDNVKL